MFIAIVYMLNTSTERDEMRKVAEEWAKNKQDIYKALHEEFKGDLQKWQAEIEPDTLIVRFKEPTVLFHLGECYLTPRFEEILHNFFPRYLSTLEPFEQSISEIRIEGHTSSEWNDTATASEAYFNNMRLSQDRTREVLSYCMSQAPNAELRKWGQRVLIAAGMSSSRLVLANGTENPEASRRVEFRVRTKADEKLTLILEQSQKANEDQNKPNKALQ
jgi:outer membrane protein OmpA-like peptidoglycan-associated protein